MCSIKSLKLVFCDFRKFADFFCLVLCFIGLLPVLMLVLAVT